MKNDDLVERNVFSDGSEYIEEIHKVRAGDFCKEEDEFGRKHVLFKSMHYKNEQGEIIEFECPFCEHRYHEERNKDGHVVNTLMIWDINEVKITPKKRVHLNHYWGDDFFVKVKSIGFVK